jgi:hypothetical protein
MHAHCCADLITGDGEALEIERQIFSWLLFAEANGSKMLKALYRSRLCEHKRVYNSSFQFTHCRGPSSS